MTSRDAAINLAFRAGATIAEIAEATGFDPERVMAILDKPRVPTIELFADLGDAIALTIDDVLIQLDDLEEEYPD